MTISQSTITQIRKAKTEGYSLNDIAKSYNVAKSTASLYCRDLFDDPRRIYQTEEDARTIMALHQTHTYYPCPNCGKIIRKDRKLCKSCDNLRRQFGNPICRFCGNIAHKDGFARHSRNNSRRAYSCDHCGKHFLLDYLPQSPRTIKARLVYLHPPKIKQPKIKRNKPTSNKTRTRHIRQRRILAKTPLVLQFCAESPTGKHSCSSGICLWCEKNI